MIDHETFTQLEAFGILISFLRYACMSVYHVLLLTLKIFICASKNICITDIILRAILEVQLFERS